MSDSTTASPADDERNGSPFDRLMQSAGREPQPDQPSFTIGFRGYDKQEVDAAVAELTARVQRSAAEVAELDERYRAELEQLRTEQNDTIDTLRAENEQALERLGAELAATRAHAADAEQQIAALSTQLVEGPDGADEPQTRQQFEAVLKVAEEQANVLVQNATGLAERMLESAREEVASQRAELDADVARITAQAQHDADQVRLRMDTEFAAHEARIQRESAHAAEKVAQAEQEAAAVRTEAEKGAAALRAMVTRETAQLRADAERDLREMNARVLEFEETLTRRQDDAQQEFLVLHNQAVAHAERITADANEQVASSLDHAQRISAKADDYERLMRAQASQIEADAQVRARDTLDRSRIKAQKIVDTVIGHTTAVLRDAEDQTRQLRWQQQHLTSFMAEVRELIRPDGVHAAGTDADAPDQAGDDPQEG
ncbi:MAG: cell division initiation protein [Microbacterium sp.]|uniref:cell division initiation protein n=1 Tax=Microbacterium sp. TaxID=51671 RepID=UPI002632C8C3|nr:cell division initiation protein [Microbacterium sp.]MCX6501534.1 cell division initiation protein [Microbacterium sp.]